MSMAVSEKKEIKKRSDNLSDWYTDVIQKAEIAEYGPARGTMVIRPYGFGIWKRIQSELGKRINEAGVEDAYFPLFIPYSLLEKEKTHVEGFSPELAVVTKGGGKELEDPLVVRPTSETIMYEMYAKWIHSWRDLPLKVNQWNSVVRWEKRTLLFIRTSEFLWQEGHCAHATEAENMEMVLQALEWYRSMYMDFYAIPVVTGIKSTAEKFAGADATYGVEALMPDGKALQGATSHNLGQNFSKAQNISFQSKEEKTEYVWQNSWGFSTRTLGALFMTHGDEDGLIIPPRVAPIQVVIIPFSKSPEVSAYVEGISEHLKANGVRVRIDDRETLSPGRKFNEWEVKGVPIRVEVGEREFSDQMVTVVSRDDGEKISVARDDIDETVNSLIDGIQDRLFQKANQFLLSNTHEVEKYDQFKEIMSTTRGFIKAYWCEDPECEAKIKEETKATTRVRPIDGSETDGSCVYCGKKAKHVWYFAQAY